MKAPTLPVPKDAKPLRVELSRGASLVLPKGTRQIKIDEGGGDRATVGHYYLNEPMSRGFVVTEYPLKGRSCESLIAAREAAFEAAYSASKDDQTPQDEVLRRFHRGARCKVAGAACYFSDTSRRTSEEARKGARLHRQTTFMLCKDEVAVSVAWKIPDGAEVSNEIIDGLTRIAGTFTTTK